MSEVFIKRIYDPASEVDGFRVLVDRLWPRGVSKENAALDMWAKDMAPSNELRRKYHNNLVQFDLFRDNYIKELENNEETKAFVSSINSRLNEANVTLLTASKNVVENHATVLRELILK
ncbi:DUF488 domain-containing protein [Gudongella sp. SC589]|jgi:uncharacterized protein YeaO (DUF488 family)|uniref:DUF488 domain-containing protein n=1 Tax=Gudongella sp. SC589 TaxID=3385990 RepID=UPI003904C0F3